MFKLHLLFIDDLDLFQDLIQDSTLQSVISTHLCVLCLLRSVTLPQPSGFSLLWRSLKSTGQAFCRCWKYSLWYSKMSLFAFIPLMLYVYFCRPYQSLLWARNSSKALPTLTNYLLPPTYFKVGEQTHREVKWVTQAHTESRWLRTQAAGSCSHSFNGDTPLLLRYLCRPIWEFSFAHKWILCKDGGI